MILTEQTTLPAASLPLDLLKQHLRLGTAFASATEQDELLEAYLRAAIAGIEGRTGQVLMAKSFTWQLHGWRSYDRQILPLRPVQQVTAVRLVDRFDAVSVVDADRYYLAKDAQNPALIAVGLALPVVPQAGTVEIDFDAGYGADWSDVPEDLARAVILLAADFYDNRTSRDALGWPTAVLALVERFRKLRLGATL